MKKYPVLVLICLLLGTVLFLSGCNSPNLVVSNANIDFQARTVSVTVKNDGGATAGQSLTYVEINDVGAAATLKPQTQHSLDTPPIAAGASWNSPVMPFSFFRGIPNRGSLDVNTLTQANLVVTADAKGAVAESNEQDNVSNANLP